MDQSHDLMASIVSPFLYEVAGTEGDQIVSFKTRETFSLFAIRVGELISEARGNVAVQGAPANLSLVNGLRWVTSRLAERSAAPLASELAALESWLSTTDSCRFWCSGLDMHFTFSATRSQLWNIHANNAKHNFLRLQKVTKQLASWAAVAGRPVRGSEVLNVLESFTEWLDGYCQYHSTRMTELVGRVLAALNAVIVERWEANDRSNDSRIIAHPQGTSEFFEGLHTGLLVFRRYSESRIWDYVPSTSPNLLKPYNP